MFNRMFVLVVIGAIILVLAIFGIIVLVLGDNEDQGGEINRNADAAPSVVHDYVSETWRTGTA
jgi:hypothetical protein